MATSAAVDLSASRVDDERGVGPVGRSWATATRTSATFCGQVLPFLVTKGWSEMRSRLAARRCSALFTRGPHLLIFLFSPPYILFLDIFLTKLESTTLL
jgi:hypothetical protein